jgi:hypothetical protein
MISVEENPQNQVLYITGVLQYVQKDFQQIILNAETNPQYLLSRDNIRSIDKFLKVNHRIVEAVGAVYVHYLA